MDLLASLFRAVKNTALQIQGTYVKDWREERERENDTISKNKKKIKKNSFSSGERSAKTFLDLVY